MLLVLGKAWEWFKKNWMWVILFPVALAAYLFGRDHGEVTVLTDDTESDAAKKRIEDIDKQVAEERAEETVKLWKRTRAVIEEHRETVDNLTEEQDKEVDELLKDPDALNEYLLEVGRKARG
jgi:hypothetical protein